MSVSTSSRARISTSRAASSGREHALARRRVQDRPRRLERVGELVLGDRAAACGLVDRGRGLSDAGREPLALGDRRLVA